MATRSDKKFFGVEALKHDAARRKNIPTAEFQSLLADDEKSPVRLAYARRNRDLDPQLLWRGKDAQDAADLAVQAPPLYIQEKLHPKVLIDDLLRGSRAGARGDWCAAGPVWGLQRPAGGCRQDRVLRARAELVEPDDPGR